MFISPPNAKIQEIYSPKPYRTGAYVLSEFPDGIDWIYTANPEKYIGPPKFRFFKTPDHMKVEE